MNKGVKLLFAAAAITVYVAFPPYRYWVLGSWMAARILTDRGRVIKHVSKT